MLERNRTAIKKRVGVLPCKQPKTACAAEIGHLRREHLLYFNVFWWKRHLTLELYHYFHRFFAQDYFQMVPIDTLHETNSSPLKTVVPNRKSHLNQPSIFKGRTVSFQGGYVPKIGVPQNGWFIMENPIKIWGYHHFRKPPYFVSIHHPWRKRGKSKSSLNLKVESSRSGAKLVSRSHGEAVKGS